MAVESFELALPHTKEGDVLDVSSNIQELVSKSGIREGMALVFVVGSTGAITTVEFEPGLVEDIGTAMERLAPKDGKYGHEEMWHDGNGHSHIRATMLGPDITVPVTEGKLVLGTWQQIVFLELDNKPRSRRLMVKVMGES